jgi:hypothetical protein
MKYLILSVALACAACGNDSPSSPSKSTPPPPTVPACQSNTTAQLTFENRTPNYSHDLYLDGAKMALLGPGQTSQPFTVAANTQHQVRWVYTNTNRTACTVMPVPATCSTTLYYCSF